MLNIEDFPELNKYVKACECGSKRLYAWYDYKPKWFIGFHEWYDIKCADCKKTWRVDKNKLS